MRAIAPWKVAGLIARFHQEFVIFTSSFLGAWLAAAWTFADDVPGDEREHLIEEMKNGVVS